MPFSQYAIFSSFAHFHKFLVAFSIFRVSLFYNCLSFTGTVNSTSTYFTLYIHFLYLEVNGGE